MLKQELKLEFIENGRLTNGEMNEIVGGGVTSSCQTFDNCGAVGKRDCTKYISCMPNSRTECDKYTWMNPGFDVAVAVADISSSNLIVATESVGVAMATIKPISVI